MHAIGDLIEKLRRSRRAPGGKQWDWLNEVEGEVGELEAEIQVGRVQWIMLHNELLLEKRKVAKLEEVTTTLGAMLKLCLEKLQQERGA